MSGTNRLKPLLWLLSMHQLTPSGPVPGTYEGGLKTWKCALDLAAYLNRDVLGYTLAPRGPGLVAAGRRVRGLRVLEVGFVRLMGF